MQIGKVLGELTERQRERLAKKNGVTPNGLANSYKKDWVRLMKDMTDAELTRVLGKCLDASELRIVALRAFDGRKVVLSGRQQSPKGIIEKLCHTAPQKLRKETWKDVYAKLLQDVGWKSEKTPAGLEDSIKLRRIFE